MNLCPILMVKNEEYYIQNVLRPLAGAFPLIIVGDTGSTDATIEKALAVSDRVEVMEFGPQKPRDLPQIRKRMAERAAEQGLEWVMQVDGDELYHPKSLQLIKEIHIPAGMRAVFTSAVTIDRRDGVWWRLDDYYSRLAIYPGLEQQVGDYPFEWPLCYKYPETYYYIPPVDGLTSHHLHLHRLRRSPGDSSVFRRKEKQRQFSMIERDVPWLDRLEKTWTDLL